MIVLELEQGSEAWLEKRREHNTASEAPAMRNKSKHMSRSDLVRMKATGVQEEINNYVQEVVFKEGHRVEELARPIAEEIIGEPLFPVVATDDDGYLLASFDGITMGEDIIWECKQWNEEKAREVRDFNIPENDIDQVIQQLIVSGAERCLYMITDGTEERTMFCWYSLQPSDKEDLLSGWKQLDEDVANYQHIDPVVEVAGKAPETLPALRIEVTGMVTDSNLIEFKANAMAVIDEINADLVTDEDFSTAKATVKWLKGIEQKLDDAKQNALGQTQSIDELFRAIDDIKEVSKKKRINLNTTVTVREKARKEEIVMSGKKALADYIEAKNIAFGKAYMPAIMADFPGAVHGLKLMSKRQDAVDAELARAKIEVNKAAEKIQTNLDSLRDLASDHKFLFPDIMQVIHKDNDDLVSLIKVRISDHKAKEEKRREEEREKIRLEEQEKIRAEGQQETNEVESELSTLCESKKVQNHEQGIIQNPSWIRPEKDTEETINIITDSLIENGIGKQVAKKVAGLLVNNKVTNTSVIFLTK